MKICWFDPGRSDNQGTPSLNLGDLIIQRAVEREIKNLFPSSKVIAISTHSPLTNQERRKIRKCDHMIVGGTNLLSSNMRQYKQWQISIKDVLFLRRKVVLLGVGWWQYQGPLSKYTHLILKNTLSSRAIHSVRDEYTRQKLRAVGFQNVVNTGCPTMWPFIEFNFDAIPSVKAENVLVMLTDYNKDVEADRRLLDVVSDAYEQVFLWPQGSRDAEYVKSLGVSITLLDHSLASLERFIESGIPFDYIGTRLHGGIRCLLAKRRSLIIEVDNRAAEIGRDTNLPTVPRYDFDSIKAWIHSPARINITIDGNAIKVWKNQFGAL